MKKKSTYDTWEERYQELVKAGEYKFSPEPGAAALYGLDHVEILSRHRPHAIDVGAGEGRYVQELIRRGFFVDALELSPTAVKRAQDDGVGGDSARWIVGDGATFVPETKYDLVFSANVHILWEELRAFVTNISSWVDDNGWLVLVGHSRKQAGRDVHGPKDPDVLWDVESLSKLVSDAGLVLLVAEDRERTPKASPDCILSPDSIKSGISVDTVIVARRR